jgi:hypothetical protein
MADGPRAVVHPDLPARVRRRLTRLNPAARPADHLPWNKPVTDARQAIRAAVACLVLLAVNLMLVAVIAVSGRDLDWKHDRMGDMLWLLAGQAAVLLLGAAGCWLVGAWRTVRRRAPVLRRRHAGRYVSADEVTELRDDAPMVGNLVAQAVRQRWPLSIGVSSLGSAVGAGRIGWKGCGARESFAPHRLYTEGHLNRPHWTRALRWRRRLTVARTPWSSTFAQYRELADPATQAWPADPERHHCSRTSD